MILTNKFDLNVFCHSDKAIECGIDNAQVTDKQLSNLQELHKLFIEIQSRLSIKFAKQILINFSSVFRCQELNDAIRGEKTSQHLEGEAGDSTAIGITLEEYYQSLRQLAKDKILVFGQVILEYGRHPDSSKDDWLHCSLPNKKWINDFKRSPIMNKDGAKIDGKREYIKEPI